MLNLKPIRRGATAAFMNKGRRIQGVVASATHTHATVKASGRHYRVRLEDLEA